MAKCPALSVSKADLNVVLDHIKCVIASAPARGHHDYEQQSFGLAVSGGVDSMALAHLGAKARQEADQARRPRLRAFIIDHGMRMNSMHEARLARHQLRRMGLSVTILKVQWPPGRNPDETLARRARFRLLGLACRHFRITKLLLAHHLDDQAETVLMRLAAGHRGIGLRGFKSKTAIPECDDLYGVHESGTCTRPSFSRLKLPLHNLVPGLSRPGVPVEAIAAGGVRVLRPLRHTRKAVLTALCMSENVKWFEDETNMDTTLTMRNSIRHLLQHDLLPNALRIERLLALSGRMAETERRPLVHTKPHGHNGVNIHALDLRTGTAQLTISQAFLSGPGMFGEVKQGAPGRHEWLQAGLLRKVLSVVAPSSVITLDQAALALDRLRIPASQSLRCADAFTVAGTLWKPAPAPHAESTHQSATWTVTRTPHPRHAHPRCTWSSRALTHHCLNPAFPTPGAARPFDSWQLYDHRWWIRARHATATTLVAEPLRPDALAQLRRGVTAAQRRRLDAYLAAVAPGHVRYTLPVLRAGDDEDVLALPTLGLVVESARETLEWRIQYRWVNLDVDARGKIAECTRPSGTPA